MLLQVLAGLSGQSCQTLQTLDINHMNLSDNKCIIFVPSLLKHSHKGVHQAPIGLIAFPVNHSLCIVYLLQMYIKRTCELRREENYLSTTIIRAAGWASDSIYAKFYKKTPTFYKPKMTKFLTTTLCSVQYANMPMIYHNIFYIPHLCLWL